MRKFDSMDELYSKLPDGGLKAHLVSKFSRIIEEYGLSDICDVFSVIVLEKFETDYFGDKYLEFCEEISLDDVTWLHTVWAASDSYSEDIYIPYNDEAKTAIEKRCL